MTQPGAEYPAPVVRGAQPPAPVSAQPDAPVAAPAPVAQPPIGAAQDVATRTGIIKGAVSAEARRLAVAAAVAAAAPPERPPTPRGGTVYVGGDPLDGQPVTPSGRQPALRIGWQTASLSALSTLGVTSPGTGLILGANHEGQPIPIRFFRPEPTRISLVGGVWAAQMLAFRALALGAQVVVMTVDPQTWHGFSERAVGRPDGVVVLHGEQPGRAIGTALRPVLIIQDLGTNAPMAPPPVGPWQTQLAVLRRLVEAGVPAIQRRDLLILQRLHPTEAAIAEAALRLTGQSVQLLQMMEDEMLALIGGGANRYLWLHPTSVERQFMGNAWR